MVNTHVDVLKALYYKQVDRDKEYGYPDSTSWSSAEAFLDGLDPTDSEALRVFLFLERQIFFPVALLDPATDTSDFPALTLDAEDNKKRRELLFQSLKNVVKPRKFPSLGFFKHTAAKGVLQVLQNAYERNSFALDLDRANLAEYQICGGLDNSEYAVRLANRIAALEKYLRDIEDMRNRVLAECDSIWRDRMERPVWLSRVDFEQKITY